MAKMFRKVSKNLLEKQINQLSYQIELLEADVEIYKDKLNNTYAKNVDNLKEKHRKELFIKEVEQLSNEDYVEYYTQDELSNLEKKYSLDKRVLIAKQTRYAEKNKDNEGLLSAYNQKIELEINALSDKFEQAKKTLFAKHSSRNYSDSKIKLNRETFKQTEAAATFEIDDYSKKLKEEHASLLESKKIKVQQKILNKQQRLEQKRMRLKPIIHAENERYNQETTFGENVILQVENLCMNFGGLKAVDTLSFEVKKGEIFGLIGPNGAGKTTVFNCITQFYKPSSGKILFKNKEKDIVSLNDYKVHNVIKQGIVRTFQNVELIWELSILDNMLVGAHSLYRSRFLQHSFQTRSFKREEKILQMKAEKILMELELYPYKDIPPLGLPYGILKKIELARTLMTNPSLIILDEPAAGLNEAETATLAETIKKIQKDFDTTIFLVEHDMGLVMSVCDRICAISFGKKLALGTPAEIQNNQLVKEAYLGGE